MFFLINFSCFLKVFKKEVPEGGSKIFKHVCKQARPKTAPYPSPLVFDVFDFFVKKIKNVTTIPIWPGGVTAAGKKKVFCEKVYKNESFYKLTKKRQLSNT